MGDEQLDCFSRQVIIGGKDAIKDGTVELPPEFLQETGIRSGHHVVIQHGGRHMKAKVRVDDLLKRGEVRVSMKMAQRLGIENGTIVCVEDKVTFTERVFDEVEELVDSAEETYERAKDRVFEEGAEIREERRERALDMLIPSRTEESPPTAIEVEPDLSHLGESTEEEPVKDITEQVKVWTPDPEGDGVEEFRPGGDEEEEEG